MKYYIFHQNLPSWSKSHRFHKHGCENTFKTTRNTCFSIKFDPLEHSRTRPDPPGPSRTLPDFPGLSRMLPDPPGHSRIFQPASQPASCRAPGTPPPSSFFRNSSSNLTIQLGPTVASSRTGRGARGRARRARPRAPGSTLRPMPGSTLRQMRERCRRASSKNH